MRSDRRKSARMLDRALDLTLGSGDRVPRNVLSGLEAEAADELLLALALHDRFKPLQPDAAMVQRTRSRVLQRIEASFSPPGRRRRPAGDFPRSRSLLAAASASMLLSLLGFWSAYALMFRSLPGEIGFPLKRGMEEIRLAWSPAPLNDAELLSAFSVKRSMEVQLLQLRGDMVKPGLDAYAVTLGRWIEALDTVLADLPQQAPETAAVALSETDRVRIREQQLLLQASMLDFSRKAALAPRQLSYTAILESGSVLLEQLAAHPALGESFAAVLSDVEPPAVSPQAGGHQLPGEEGISTLLATGQPRPTGEGRGTPASSREPAISWTPADSLPTRALSTPTGSSSSTPSGTATPVPHTAAVTPSSTPTEESRYGDVNLDKLVDLRDVLLLRKYLTGLEQLSSLQQELADCVRDGSLDDFDVQAISLHVSGFALQLPLEPSDLPSGDVNNDGQVTPGDALMVAEYLTGEIQLTTAEKWAADVFWDGTLNDQDPQYIFYHYMGTIPSLPVVPPSAPVE